MEEEEGRRERRVGEEEVEEADGRRKGRREKEAKGKWRLVQPGEEVLGMGRGRWLFLFL